MCKEYWYDILGQEEVNKVGATVCNNLKGSGTEKCGGETKNLT